MLTVTFDLGQLTLAPGGFISLLHASDASALQAHTAAILWCFSGFHHALKRPKPTMFGHASVFLCFTLRLHNLLKISHHRINVSNNYTAGNSDYNKTQNHRFLCSSLNAPPPKAVFQPIRWMLTEVDPSPGPGGGEETKKSTCGFILTFTAAGSSAPLQTSVQPWQPMSLSDVD